MGVNRRVFLKSAAAVLCLPAGLVRKVKAESKSKVILRFAAMSDLHFDKEDAPDAPRRIRLAKAIQAMNSYAPQQEYPAFDALLAVGDLSDHGLAEELTAFRAILDREMKPETTRVLCVGNHELYEGSQPLFEEIFSTEANRHIVLNGCHFIVIAPETGNCEEGDYAYIRDWFASELKKASEDTPDRPIFVVQHYNVYNTTWGSADLPGDFPCGVKDLLGVIDWYPQVVHITGHTHAPTIHPRSVWQGTFTSVGTGSLCDYSLFSEGVGDFRRPEGVDVNQAGTFLIFEVYDDHSILIKLYDTICDSFLDREYLLIDPCHPETHVYTDRRLDTAASPFWPEGSRLEVVRTSADSVQIAIPAARDDSCVTYYTVTVEKAVPGEGDSPRVLRFWSDFFMKTPAPRLNVSIDQLAAGTAYRVRVTGTNAFNKPTPTEIEIEFTTAKG
ncbi:MAG: metallophosphoesterase [Thermoguttaceae bacterium]|nr:metallophosphoesterase [Thermoguttaceae bacterium]